MCLYGDADGAAGTTACTIPTKVDQLRLWETNPGVNPGVTGVVFKRPAPAPSGYEVQYRPSSATTWSSSSVHVRRKPLQKLGPGHSPSSSWGWPPDGSYDVRVRTTDSPRTPWLQTSITLPQDTSTRTGTDTGGTGGTGDTGEWRWHGAVAVARVATAMVAAMAAVVAVVAVVPAELAAPVVTGTETAFGRDRVSHPEQATRTWMPSPSTAASLEARINRSRDEDHFPTGSRFRMPGRPSTTSHRPAGSTDTSAARSNCPCRCVCPYPPNKPLGQVLNWQRYDNSGPTGCEFRNYRASRLGRGLTVHCGESRNRASAFYGSSLPWASPPGCGGSSLTTRAIALPAERHWRPVSGWVCDCGNGGPSNSSTASGRTLQTLDTGGNGHTHPARIRPKWRAALSDSHGRRGSASSVQLEST